MGSYDDVKTQLLSMRNDYKRRIKAIDVDAHHKEEPVEKDFAEQATQRENDDVLAALDDEAREMVVQIDRALTRIEEGSYGICAGCGTQIPGERLKVAPFADLCIDCAEKNQ